MIPAIWRAFVSASESLREGQEVVIVGNVVRRKLLNERGDYALRRDGSAIWLTDFRAQEGMSYEADEDIGF